MTNVHIWKLGNHYEGTEDRNGGKAEFNFIYNHLMEACQKHKASAAANALYRLFLAALDHADLRRRSQYDVHKIHADAENENPDIAHDEVIKRQHAADIN